MLRSPQQSILKMWPKFRTSISKKDKSKPKESHKVLNVNEEYLCAVRTKSYADFSIKVQLLVNEPRTSPTYSRTEPSFLDPGQETIASVLESAILPKHSSNLKSLLLNYFDMSAEASEFCSHLLRTVNQLQSDCNFINQVISTADDNKFSDQCNLIDELHSVFVLDNPFSNIKKQDFSRIHDKHSSVLQHLKSMKKKIARKVKFIKFFNKASGVCVAAACGILAAVAMFLAMHTLTALLMGPALFVLPVKPLKKRLFNVKFLKHRFLNKIGEQLDVAAKGAYILNRDFDTMSRLVGRLQDEVEHNKAMIRFCLDRREDRLSVQVVKELKKCQFGFRKQVEELEEHVYLCLVTINRARTLVIKEISRTCSVK